ncbi:flavin reductase family protein [Rathayibacter caricis]|uniref:flavin reductase family protein n=1 Tax=Rathayibacter caricis TaxID=110936 RepID=UPI001FB5223A|nr:flavin reductase family protein [Rathayibacter caricis]MCJ1697343.1 flavin reductase family protein [Rathayibacter caricis]
MSEVSTGRGASRIVSEPRSAAPRAGHGSVDADHFKAAFRYHPGGVTVVTADDGRGPVGLTATSVISASVEPNIFAFSVSEFSSSTPTIVGSETVVVHFLGVEEAAIAKLCATSGIDRFADTTVWSRLPTGEPYFHGASRWLRGRIVSSMPAGRSTILAVEALDASEGLAQSSAAPSPLVYFDRSWRAVGSNPAA